MAKQVSTQTKTTFGKKRTGKSKKKKNKHESKKPYKGQGK